MHHRPSKVKLEPSVSLSSPDLPLSKAPASVSLSPLGFLVEVMRLGKRLDWLVDVLQGQEGRMACGAT